MMCFTNLLTYLLNHCSLTISQLPNLCTGIRTIDLLAATHFAARLGAFFYGTRFIWSTLYRLTIPLRFI